MSVEVVTFGCRLNAAESEVIRRNAEQAGLSDTVVINTCAVTAEAVRQARQSIRALRRERPAANIVVTGCAAQTEPQTFAAMPEADRVLGNAEKLTPSAWASVGAARIKTNAPKAIVGDIMAIKQSAAHLIDTFSARTRAFVQVQNGCDHRCTFCIIPFGRGNSRSVPMDAVVEDVRRLVAHGYLEVVLTGVDITSYGTDLSGAPALGTLVKRILKDVPELKRLRLSSIELGRGRSRSARCVRQRRKADAAPASVAAIGRRPHPQAHEAAAFAGRCHRVLPRGAAAAARHRVRRGPDCRLPHRERSDVSKLARSDR